MVLSHLLGKQMRRLGGGMRKRRSLYRERGQLRRSGTLRGMKRADGRMQLKVKTEVAKVKERARGDLSSRLDSKEGETDFYRSERQRDGDGEDMKQTRVIKDGDGNALTDSGSLTGRWREYFEELMNEENA